MKKIIAKLSLTALLISAPISTAFALPSGFSVTSNSGQLSTAESGTITYDFDILSPIITDNYDIVSGSVLNKYAQPYNDATKYLTVPKDINQNPQSATIDFGYFTKYLGLYWGSIDTYNNIEFFNGATSLGVIDGSEIGGGDYGSHTSALANRYVNFFSTTAFDKIILSSTNYAFELDNLSTAPIPEPGVSLLVALGVAGFASVARRKKN